MRAIASLAATILSFAVCAAEAGSDEGSALLGDKDKGHAYAQKFCTDCHAVEKDENLLLGDIPTFQEVADSDGMSPRALGVWLRTSHPNMPDFIIAPDDMDNVIAYIMSLRAPRK